VLFEFGPARKSVRACGHELGIDERQVRNTSLRARVKLAYQREGLSVTGANRGEQSFRLFPEMFE
jgi:hypothetical protein